MQVGVHVVADGSVQCDAFAVFGRKMNSSMNPLPLLLSAYACVMFCIVTDLEP